MDDHRERPGRPHWGWVVVFAVPVIAVVGFLTWLFDRLTGWSILPR